MEIGEDMAGASGYYNDLLNRVDTTIHQSRSAYGGEHAQQTAATSQSACLGTEKDPRFQVYLLWGSEGRFDRETRSGALIFYLFEACAVTLALAPSLRMWFLLWLCATLLVHAIIVAARLGLERLDIQDQRRAVLAGGVFVCFVWIVVSLATHWRDSAKGMQVFIGVVTVGLVLAEAAARILTPKCDAFFRRTPPPQEEPQQEEDLRYASL